MHEWNPRAYGGRELAVDAKRRGELSPVLQEAYGNAQKLLSAHAIDPNSFSDLYGTDVIRKDLSLVESLKKKFGQLDDPISKTARVFEAVVFDQAERANWLGPDAETIKSSDFDDYTNGIDMIVEFDADQHSPKHLALAVDVTFGTAALKKKFEKIRSEIDNDDLAHMKYFHSERGGYRGELSQLPRAIIGVEHDTVAQLAGLWTKKHNALLAKHEVQRIIAEEIYQQMKTFLAYARHKGSPKATAAYERAATIAGRILDQKRAVPFDELDRVFQGIRTELLSF